MEGALPKYELWCRILSRIELDQRSREARLQLEQIEWLLIPPASGKKRFFEGGRGGGGTSQTGRVRRAAGKGQSVGIGLAQAQLEAARGRLAASEGEDAFKMRHARMIAQGAALGSGAVQLILPSPAASPVRTRVFGGESHRLVNE
jgi:hypothetical protein